MTVSAHQAGNSVYASADAQESFYVNQGRPVIHWNPGPIIYGTPLDSSILDASATSIPAANPSADNATVTWQLNTSEITGGSGVTIPPSSPVLRYEGAPMVVSNDAMGWTIDPTMVGERIFKIAFTCDCQEFEFAIQTSVSFYRLWVDGSWQTPDSIAQENDHPKRAYYRVQFPDKRARQIKIGLVYGPPFYGLVTHPDDTVSAPQVPDGQRTIIFGDSWTGPTISEPLLPPSQPGVPFGSGYAQILGEYFNWDWWEDGLPGTGFVHPGPSGITFAQRAQTDICGRDPDTVVVMGGGNDAATEAVEEDAVTNFLSELQTCVPNAKVLLFGPQGPDPATAAGMAAAAAKFSGNVFYWSNTQTWIYGQPDDPTTGNAYLYFNGHPTPLGHDYWAEQMANILINAFPSLAPQNFFLFDPAPATGTISYSVAQQAILPAGQHQISVTFTPQDTADYSTVTQQETLTVEKATTNTSLSSTASNIALGSVLTLASTVAPQIGGTPTGTVTFLDNGNAIGTVALNQSGTALFNNSSLAIGTHAFTVLYSGDGNFLGSMSSQSVSVTVVKPDFSFSISSTQLIISPTQSGTTTVTVTPIAGLVAKLNLTCTGLPANASCSMANGGQITVNNQTTQATVVIEAYAPRKAASNGELNLNGIEFCGVFGFIFGFGRKPRRAVSRRIISVLLLFASFTLINGCGSNSKINTPEPGTYTVQLTLSNAADSSTTHSQTITVVIP